MRAQPFDKFDDLSVAPHPGWKPFEIPQRFDGELVLAGPANITIGAISIGPILLDGHGGESFLLNQTLGDARALVIALVRAVRGLSQQHETRVANSFQQGVIVLVRVDQPMRALTY